MQYLKQQGAIASCRDTLADNMAKQIHDLLKDRGWTYDTTEHKTPGYLTSTDCSELYRWLNQQSITYAKTKLRDKYSKFYYGIFDATDNGTNYYIKNGEYIKQTPASKKQTVTDRDISPISDDEFEKIFE